MGAATKSAILTAILGKLATGVSGSGTGTREMILDRKCLPRMAAGPVDEKALRLRRMLAGAAPNHVLWAACRSDQYSADADVGGKPGGAFTYFFCRHIRDTGGKIARCELLKRVRASLKCEGFSQVPQLECPADHKT